MKVVAEIKRSDLIWFNAILLPRLKSTYVTIAVITALVFFLLVQDTGFPATSHEWLIMSASSIVGGLGGMVAGTLISFIFILMTSSKTNGILGNHEYEISHQGLHEKTLTNEGLIKWQGIQAIRIVEPYVLFRISAFLFHIIPKRSFTTGQEFRAFAQQAQIAWESVHSE